MTETTDARMTEFGTPAVRRRWVPRRSSQPSTDPRRAPGRVAEPPARSSESGLPADAAPHAVATGITAGAAAIREALRSMPAGPGVYRMLDRRGDALY